LWFAVCGKKLWKLDGALGKEVHSVILNEVKDLKVLKSRDSSLRGAPFRMTGELKWLL
jgi:hypothetical protein